MTQQDAYEIAIGKMPRYATATELRNTDMPFYLFLRKWGLCHLMPKGTNYSKLVWPDAELIAEADPYQTIQELRSGNPKLLAALKSRGILPERFAKKKKEPKPPKPARQQKTPEPVHEPQEEPEPEPRSIIPALFLKGNRKGPYACFRATPTPTGFLCGRCREEYPKGKHHRLCNDLCQKCYNAMVLSQKNPSVVLNIHGNIRDEYCHIVLNLPDGPMYIGLEVTQEERRKLLLAGYSFIMK